MTRTELLSSSTLASAIVTASGPNTLVVGREVWELIRSPRSHTGRAIDMLNQARNSEASLAEDRAQLIAQNARRTGKTFAMAGMKLQVQEENGDWAVLPKWAAGDSSGRVLDAVMDRFEIIMEESTFSKLRRLCPEDFPARETKGYRRIAPRNGLHPDRKVRA